MDDITAYAIPGFREPISCFTHLLAVPVFAILGCFLVRRGRESWFRSISLAIMAITSVFLLSMSAVYHLLPPGIGRNVMRQLDVAGIFALIAGTITPIHVILFRGFNRWAPLLLVWSTAAVGITFRTIYFETFPRSVGAVIFLVMGWGGLISYILLRKRYGSSFVNPLLWGGISYTVGTIVAVMNWPAFVPGIFGAHELWHIAVLTGLGLHWKFAFQFAGGPPDAKLEQGSGARSNPESGVCAEVQ